MKKRHTKEENWAQARAFRCMPGDELELIRVYAEDFREIITEYEIAHDGHVPTSAELLWLESQRQGRDITE